MEVRVGEAKEKGGKRRKGSRGKGRKKTGTGN